LTVAVATYGDRSWTDLAFDRAIPSAHAQCLPTVFHHGDDITDARNRALEIVDTEWVVFLDADDELAGGYAQAMAGGSADLRAPAVEYVHAIHRQRPRVPRVFGHQHDCFAECLVYGNWLVIGTAVRAELVRKVGGFRDYPLYEDWDLWVRCWKAGATIEAVPAAVYVAHVREDSRNRGPSQADKLAAHQAIAMDNDLWVPA
jgi:GT2 family glycosyltransferase